MDPNTTLTVKKLFYLPSRFEIPIFQRPYAWRRVDHWEPLWADVRGLAERALAGKSERSHFLGALVLDAVRTPTGSLETRWVIDGQQRLTTIQILLAAFGDVCASLELPDEHRAIRQLLKNDDVAISGSTGVYKVWPTGADQDHFRAVIDSGSAEVLRTRYSVGRGDDVGHPVPDAYLYFADAIRAWVIEGGDAVKARAAALRNVVRDQLRFVAIDLTPDDDAQLIFETLNARSEPLLPSDLVKNLLFRDARDQRGDVVGLHARFWKPLDEESKYWRKMVGRGHARRPRIDLFLHHYLTARLRREVRVDRTYPEYRDSLRGTQADAAKNLEEFWRYSGAWRALDLQEVTEAEAKFLSVLGALGITTALPFALELRIRHLDDQKLVASCLGALESFLVRRAIVGLTTRGYGAFFANLVATIAEPRPEEALRSALRSTEAEVGRWPNDADFRAAWMSTSFPSSLVVPVLMRLEERLRGPKSEQVRVLEPLTVEHLLPQSWEAHWPLAGRRPVDEERTDRWAHVGRVGNLTLLTKSLNPSISNGPWEKKRREIEAHGTLMLHRGIVKEPSWGEAQIDARSAELFRLAVDAWPGP